MHTTNRSSKCFATLETALPKIVVAPSFMVMVVFIYGFILWTLYLSMTRSSFLPSYDFVGLAQYAKLWRIERWGVAVRNLLIYGGLFIFFCTLFGLLLAIFLDQKIRIEGALRTIYLYPLALSFVVTGPGYASDLPATFMYSYAFTRGRLALGAASAMMMFFMVMAVIVPYLYSELRRKQHA